MTRPNDYRDDLVAQARSRCADITRQQARNFYYGLKLLPQPKRDAMYVIYAWNRRADDCADGQIEGNPKPSIAKRREALDRLQEQTERVFAGDTRENLYLMMALRWVVETFHLSPEPFRDMIAGQRADLDGGAVETVDDLLTYCRQVGSSVGRVSIDIWGYQHDDAPELADQRGIAFQLTNIIRDFAEDFDEGRIYIPAEEFRRFDLSPADLRKWRKPEPCDALMRSLVERARTMYESSDRLDSLISADCRAASTALKEIYRRLLDKIERNLRGVATGQRVSLGSMSKVLIALQAKRSAKQLAAASSASPASE